MRIEKSECNYQVTECDLKFGEQITLDGELLIPISVLDKIIDKIKVEIEQMPSELTNDGRRMIRRGSVFRIIDKYRF